jgi:hypothetical protein
MATTLDAMATSSATYADAAEKTMLDLMKTVSTSPNASNMALLEAAVARYSVLAPMPSEVLKKIAEALATIQRQIAS